MTKAFCIKSPDGRLLLEFVGPDRSMLKFRFIHDNKQISQEDYKIVQVEISEVKDGREDS